MEMPFWFKTSLQNNEFCLARGIINMYELKLKSSSHAQAEVKELLLVRQIWSPASWYSYTSYAGSNKTHIVIPDFDFLRTLVKDRLEDTSYEVDKLLASYDCRHLFVLFIPEKAEHWADRRHWALLNLSSCWSSKEDCPYYYRVKHQIIVRSLESDF